MEDFSIKAANPLVLFMFVKMTFLSWKNYAHKYWKIIEHKKSMGMDLEDIDPESDEQSFSEEEDDDSKEKEMADQNNSKFVREQRNSLSYFMENVEFQNIHQAKSAMTMIESQNSRIQTKHPTISNLQN